MLYRSTHKEALSYSGMFAKLKGILLLKILVISLIQKYHFDEILYYISQEPLLIQPNTEGILI